VILRVAQPADAAAIATVQVEAWNATYRGLMPDDVIDRITVDDKTSMWAEAIESGAVVFIASEGDTVVGFCSVAPRVEDPGRVGEITAMYAAPHALGRGHGRRLMRAAIEWFERGGFESATLWVLGTNRLGRVFYEKAGWYADGFERTDELFGSPVHHLRYRVDLRSRHPVLP